MDSKKIESVLQSVKSGKTPVNEALDILKHLPYEDIGYAKVDHHRHLRQGVPEVIFASGKTDEQVIKIARTMYKKSRSFLISKAAKKTYNALKIKNSGFNSASGMISIGGEKMQRGNILVI